MTLEVDLVLGTCWELTEYREAQIFRYHKILEDTYDGLVVKKRYT